MSPTNAPSPAASTPTSASSVWTCPFCPLLCDDQNASAPDCALARAGLAATASMPSHPRLNGHNVSLNAALAAAAKLLSASRQPLLGGWGTDVAGARALYRLACATGAISDAAGGEAMSQALRALQDRGGYTTTLAEVRERADLIVMVGSWAPERAPRLLHRVLEEREQAPVLVFVGEPGISQTEVEIGAHRLPVLQVPLQGDLADTLACLHLLVDNRPLPGTAAPALADLAARLRAATYAVLMWEPAQLGAHAGLLIERLHQLVGRLNQRTRAAGFPLGGGQGALTAQAVHTWLSGLPLRTRVGPRGLEHDPLRFDAARLLADEAVDLLLWVAAFPGMPPPATPGLPRIVLGLPSLAAELGDERNTIFIPVATPGVQSGGHLFRTDGIVLVRLHRLPDRHEDSLPGVADVVTQLLSQLPAREPVPESLAEVLP
ncbi:formylmethanofuran dehydrogenase [Leptothrix cholodnii SP-6]|uniref:Formylmethanofuran dehydrogenase n=1 Tax=Leptothrix cholodnii (strain ATCC 51168 / LMG 8142 / SP-6) TaxID=395495 RepID=B1Y0X9_LEPCP|nr:formylmethanofuran dehydrogenase [Leptothrix cholodnii]ACB35396.1 formylmethanofuran dehydrogenase [Leptothrix cholodnii SP-6]